jgi:CheY-like chemotaxis protein
LMIRLRANGYKATVAPDALAGSTMARTIKPDLILLDISIPGGDGFKLAETFHQMPETNRTPIIFVTASKKPGLLEKVMELGAIGLYEKPFDTEQLLAAIDREFDRITDLFNARERSATNKPPER